MNTHKTLKLDTYHYGFIDVKLSAMCENDIDMLGKSLKSLCHLHPYISEWKSYIGGSYVFKFDNRSTRFRSAPKNGFHPFRIEDDLARCSGFYNHLTREMDTRYEFDFKKIMDKGAEIKITYLDSDDSLVARAIITKFVSE